MMIDEGNILQASVELTPKLEGPRFGEDVSWVLAYILLSLSTRHACLMVFKIMFYPFRHSPVFNIDVGAD